MSNNLKKESKTLYSPADVEGYRFLPSNPLPIESGKVNYLIEKSLEKFKNRHHSYAEYLTAEQLTPLGVQSSFQHYSPFPINIKSASGAYLSDLDDNKILDLSMGFGAMLAGHLHPTIVLELNSALHEGTLYVAPSPKSRQAAQAITDRFQLDWVRFANSGTEAVMYAVRLAKVFTGRPGVLKIEGGYHGSADSVNYSIKPSTPNLRPEHLPGSHSDFSYVTPYNDIQALESILKAHSSSIACFILEPVIENLGIILPHKNYLGQVRQLCDKYDIILIFDEVKTGLTAGPQGAAQRLGVTPDLICLAKSVAGGIPLAAFGGKSKYFDIIASGAMTHSGTFNGHNLAMAGVLAMDKIATPAALRNAEDLNLQALTQIAEIIDYYQLPAHSLGFGVKGAVSWSSMPLSNYKDWKENTNFDLAKLSFLWSLNNNIMTPPGQDDQWLISLAHTSKEIELLVEDFRSLASELRS